MKKLKEDPSLCERAAHPPRTSHDDIESSIASEMDDPAADPDLDADPEADPEADADPAQSWHTVSDSFHSLPAKESPGREQSIRHRSPHRQRSSIKPPMSHVSTRESASHHESGSRTPDHCKEEWDQAFG